MKSNRLAGWILGVSVPFLATACALGLADSSTLRPSDADWQRNNDHAAPRAPWMNPQDAGDRTEHEQAAAGSEYLRLAAANCFRSAIYYPVRSKEKTRGLQA